MGPKIVFRGPALEAAVGVQGGGGWVGDKQSAAHLSVAPLLDVSLDEQSLQLTSFELLLALDLVEGELQSGRGRQPGLQGRELLAGIEAGRRRRGDNRAERGRRSEEGSPPQTGRERREWSGAGHFTYGNIYRR